MLLTIMRVSLALISILSFTLGVVGQIYRDGDHWRQDSYYLKISSDVRELNGTYIGHGGTRGELSSLRYNDTANTANFSVGLFADTMGSQTIAQQFFFTYYGDWYRVPQQWSVCYCLTQMRLTLVGNIPGILDLHSNFFPVTSKIPPGVPMEWDTFITDANGTLSIDDGSALMTRRWVAYKSSKDTVYNIGLYDGVTYQPHELYNITIGLEWNDYAVDKSCWPPWEA